jgi:hypothetical protein
VHAGEPEPAIEILERLLTIPSPVSVAQLRVSPFWDPLRQYPGFQRLVRGPET